VIEFAQGRGVAALLAGRSDLVKRLGADGTHLDLAELDSAAALAAYRDARRTLGDDAIVGALCPAGRHAAMELAEAGVDYVGFDSASTDASELIAWWAEVMTTPCVAFGIGDPDTARSFAATGADFIAIEPNAWMSVDAASHLEMLRAAIQAG
jgi:thiamine-phosphate pyrophosphorylase